MVLRNETHKGGLFLTPGEVSGICLTRGLAVTRGEKENAAAAPPPFTLSQRRRLGILSVDGREVVIRGLMDTTVGEHSICSRGRGGFERSER